MSLSSIILEGRFSKEGSMMVVVLLLLLLLAGVETTPSSTRLNFSRFLFECCKLVGDRSKPPFKRMLALLRSFDISFIDARKDLDRFKVDILSLDDRLESNSIFGLDVDNLRNFIWRSFPRFADRCCLLPPTVSCPRVFLFSFFFSQILSNLITFHSRKLLYRALFLFFR